MDEQLSGSGTPMILIDSTVGLTAGRLSRWLSRRRRARQALDAGAGTIMIGLAGRLVLER